MKPLVSYRWVSGIIVVSALLFGTGGHIAMGAEGRAPISDCTTISQSGSYILTQNIDAYGKCHCISIGASDVTIDFKGHSIINAPTTCAVVWGVGYTGIIIKNGFIYGGNAGIGLNAGGGEFRIEKMTIVGADDYGINVEGDCTTPNHARALIEDNMIVRSSTLDANAGIRLKCVSGARVERNIIISQVDGIVLDDTHTSSVTFNVVNNNSQDGIRLLNSTRNTVANNIATKNGRNGIRLEGTSGSHYNVIEGNNTSENVSPGIILVSSDYNTIRENTSAGNPKGIMLWNGGFDNSIEWNYLANNSIVALQFTSSDSCGNYYGYNRYNGSAAGVWDGCTDPLAPNVRIDYIGDTNK